MTELTVEYIRSSKLSICYSDSEIQALIDRVDAGESRVDVLLSITRPDSIRVLAGLSSPEVNVKVSAFAASRAKEYAATGEDRAANAARAATNFAAAAAKAANAYAADAAAAAAYDAASAANFAVYAFAADAAAYADAFAARDARAAAKFAANAEMAITIRDYCRLLGWV